MKKLWWTIVWALVGWGVVGTLVDLQQQAHAQTTTTTVASTTTTTANPNPAGLHCLEDVPAFSENHTLPGPNPRLTSGVQKAILLVMETDTELRALFSSNAAENQYLLDLAAAIRAVYVNTDAVVTIKQIVTYQSGTDPWAATTPGPMFDELRAKWTEPAKTAAGVVGVIFVTGKNIGGGVSYVDVLCTNYAVSISQVYGSLATDSFGYNYDIETTTHEIGHIIGSPHTHCYSPPIDHCWNTETTNPNCYAGPHDQVGRGTIMSYCTISGDGTNLTLHATVKSLMNLKVGSRACLTNAPQCCGCNGCHPC